MFCTVIIPAYNVEKYIGECLESLLAQKMMDWEAICVDDGSLDGTAGILDAYQRRDPRIKVIHQANAGLSAARNVALELAQGEWLYYLDSDDVVSPWALDVYSSAAAKDSRADLLFAKMRMFQDGARCAWDDRRTEQRVVETDSELSENHFGVYFQQMLFRRSRFGHLRFVGSSWCEERPYYTRCMCLADVIVDVGAECYGYRCRQGSITAGRMTIDQFREYVEVFHTILQITASSGKRIPKGLARRQQLMALETTARKLMIAVPRADRAVGWRILLSSVKRLRTHALATLWIRFVVSFLSIAPIPSLGWVLLYMPDLMKRKLLTHR